MKRVVVPLFAVIFSLLTIAVIAPAQATSSRTWVSASGTNNGVCSRSSPCDTFADALVATSAGGEIDCVDAGSFGTVTITFAVTIDCNGSALAISAPTATVGTAGIVVNAGANDTVTIRRLTIDGFGTGNAGIDFLGGKSLEIDHVRIMHFAHWGIVVEPKNVATASITNSIISDCGTSATDHANLWIQPQGGASLTSVNVNHVELVDGANGLVIDDSNLNTIHTSVENSLASGAIGDGYLGETTGGRVTMLIDHSTAANNSANGIEAVGANTEIDIGNSRLYGNAGSTAASGGGPTLLSFGNNEVIGNGRNVAITPTSTE